jgi:hypothetical protein
LRLVRTTLLVTGIHASPPRLIAYANAPAATELHLAGLINRISVVPAAGHDADDVKAELLRLRAAAAVQGAAAITDAVDTRMQQFNEILLITVPIAGAMVRRQPAQPKRRLRHTKTVDRPASGRSRICTTGRSLTASDSRSGSGLAENPAALYGQPPMPADPVAGMLRPWAQGPKQPWICTGFRSARAGIPCASTAACSRPSRLRASIGLAVTSTTLH